MKWIKCSFCTVFGYGFLMDATSVFFGFWIHSCISCIFINTNRAGNSKGDIFKKTVSICFLFRPYLSLMRWLSKSVGGKLGIFKTVAKLRCWTVWYPFYEKGVYFIRIEDAFYGLISNLAVPLPISSSLNIKLFSSFLPLKISRISP